jgi:hypothetical protein
MSDLNSLRDTVTGEQRALLNLLWQEFRDRNRWLPRAEVHARLGEASVRKSVVELGTPILREGQEDGREDYRLTFLGVLLADEGRESEELLVRYLEYVRDRVRADAGLEWVGSREVEAALALAPTRSRHLRQLIRLSHWWGGGSGFGQRDWTVGIPLDVDDLPEHDVQGYVRRHLLAHFLPAATGGLTLVPLRPPPPRPPFGFLPDPRLAVRLAANWREAQDVCQVRAWKSCVLLCGGILQTLLRTAGGQEAAAPDAGLAALMRAAVQDGTLPEALTLTPALERYASLWDPRGEQDVTPADAEAALQAVRACLRHLPARFASPR